MISFSVDASNNKEENIKLHDFLLYSFYFPKMIQGPIVLFNDFKDKYSALKITNDKTAKGLILFILGLSKKVLLAETYAKACDYGFTNIANLNSFNLIIVSLCYCFQLYFDFSGYTDMALGTSMMIGIDMPLNFNSPYKSTSIADFWKRWHITLTKFFTKYVYIPLGGNRKGKIRTYINIFIVFMISGLWHGDGWNYIIWGFLNGLLMVIDKATSNRKRLYVIDRIFTFVLINFLWIIFRCTDFNEIIMYFIKLFSAGFGPIDLDLIKCFNLSFLNIAPMNIEILNLFKTSRFYLIGYLLIGLIITQFCKNSNEYISKNRFSTIEIVIISLLFVWSILSLTGSSQFIYAGF